MTILKNKVIYLILALCFCADFITAQDIESIFDKFKSSGNGKIMVMAHRADWRNHPENSIGSLHGAIQKGIDIVEIDTRVTADGVLVLMHDATVNRTTNGSGSVSALTLEQIKSLRLINPDGSVSEETVPTLEEFMLEAKGHIMVNLDIKHNLMNHWDNLYNVLKDTETLDHALWVHDATYETVKEKLAESPGVIYCPKFGIYQDDPVGDYTTWVTNEKLETVFFRFPSESSAILSMIPDAQARNIKLYVHTLYDNSAAGKWDTYARNDPDGNWGWLIEKGFSIIMTDRYDEMLAYLRSIGKHPHLNEMMTYGKTIKTNIIPVMAEFEASGLSEGDYIWYESDGVTVIEGVTGSICTANICESTTLYVGSIADNGEYKVPVTITIAKDEYIGGINILPTDDSFVRGGQYADTNYGSQANVHLKTKKCFTGC